MARAKMLYCCAPAELADALTKAAVSNYVTQSEFVRSVIADHFDIAGHMRAPSSSGDVVASRPVT